MKRPSLGTALSLAINIALSLALISHYFYDNSFQAYVNATVNATITQFYLPIVLAIGLGGGSGLGYLLLKKKHPGRSVAARLHRREGTFRLPGGNAAQARGYGSAFPNVASAQTAKHTAYAVPPLPKTQTPSGQRSIPSTGWSAAPRLPMPGFPPASRPEPPFSRSPQPSPQSALENSRTEQVPQLSSGGPQTPRAMEPRATSSQATSDVRVTQPSQWRSETFRIPERKNDMLAPYPKPGVEIPSKREVSTVTPPLGQSIPPPPQFQPLKWQAPQPGGRPTQWVDPVPKQGFTPPQKWLPPTAPGQRAPPLPPAAIPGRTSSPPSQRALFGQIQPPPRPLVFPGAVRPPEAGAPSGPRPPDSGRPGLLQSGTSPGRPTVPPQKPSLGQYPPAQGEKKQTSNLGLQDKLPPSSEPSESQPVSIAESKPAPEPESMVEMDWDTALDTILKTLRKDKLAEK